jgi:hypothetical protein
MDQVKYQEIFVSIQIGLYEKEKKKILQLVLAVFNAAFWASSYCHGNGLVYKFVTLLLRFPILSQVSSFRRHYLTTSFLILVLSTSKLQATSRVNFEYFIP